MPSDAAVLDKPMNAGRAFIFLGDFVQTLRFAFCLDVVRLGISARPGYVADPHFLGPDRLRGRSNGGRQLYT